MAVYKTNSSQNFRIIWWIWTILGGVALHARRFCSYALLHNLVANVAFPLQLVVAMLSFEALEDEPNFFIAFTSVACALKFAFYVLRLHKLREIESILGHLDKRIDEPNQWECFQKMSKQLRFMTALFICIFTTITLNSTLSFAFRSERALPFPAWFPLDWHSSLKSYIVAVAYEIILITTQILQNFVADLFPPLALCLIAGHCQMLTMRISRIGHIETDQATNDKELVNCIRDQEKLYMLLQLTKDIISLPMFVQFIVIALNLGAGMYALIFFVLTVQERIYYISFLFGLALETYPICYYGTLLEHVFSELHYAAFKSNWVDQSRAYRKNVLIFTERTQHQPRILAGGMVPLNLETFKANCKAAYSIFTLIRARSVTE